MNTWAQFFTPETVTRRIVADLACDQPVRLLDLGVGTGRLLAAAHGRWPGASLLGVDIDADKLHRARLRLPLAECVHADALRHDLPHLLGIEAGSIDLAVGNPPYGKFEATAEHRRILEEVDLADAVSHGRLTREVVFLAQNLRLLRHGGELAVLLPEGIGTGHAYADLRVALMARHGLWRVLELPPRLFRHTEAKTLAFFLRKGATSGTVELAHWNGGHIAVSSGEGSRRLDASYFFSQRETQGTTLASLAPDIHRGAFTHRDARGLDVPLFHTTHFKSCIDGRAQFPGPLDLPPRWLAQPGDILIPRVGARCLTHAAWVESGHAVFTDCVYRIRVAPPLRLPLLRYLSSRVGMEQRLALAHGVCAQSLSKTDLLRLPLCDFPE